MDARQVRSIAVYLSLGIWICSLALLFTDAIHPLLIYPLVAAGLAPYIVSIKVLEPWLERRDTANKKEQ